MKGKIEKIHALLCNGEISFMEIAMHYLKNIEKFNPKLNAFVSIFSERAANYADSLDVKYRCRKDIPLLCGIPMSVKDNIATKGDITSCGSKMLSNYRSVYNAFACERLFSDEALFLGKNNMDEFGFGSACEYSFYGASANPYNLNMVCGGSSGGGAAAVSSNCSVYALGSDTGGSVRLPSAFCNVVGLKPTYGAVSRYGLVAYASEFDQIGIIAPTVSDASIVFDCISCYDIKDETCSDKIRIPSYSSLNKKVKGCKVGVVENLFDKSDISLSPAYEKAISILNNLADIQNFKTDLFEMALPVYYIIASAEAASNLARYDGVRFGYRAKSYDNFEDMVIKSRSEAFGNEAKRRILLGNYVLSSRNNDKYYSLALKYQKKIKKEFDILFEKYDVLVTPVSCVPVFRLGEKTDKTDEMYTTDMCTCPVNVCGLPAVSIPCGYDKNGMPVGLQIIGRKFCEHEILNVAYHFEEEVKNILNVKPVCGGDSPNGI